MIIGFDGNEANVENRVGVNTYAYELIRNISILQDVGECKHNLIVYLKQKPLPHMPKETEKFKYKILSGSGAWILTKLTPYLFFSGDKPDVLVSPSHYSPPFLPIPTVCAIMDLGYLEFSDQFSKKVFWQLKVWSAISILSAKIVLAISKSTSNDIVRHYNFAKNKTFITPLGYDATRFNPNTNPDDVRHIRNTYSIAKDYILYLGTLKPSKNIEGLITAFYKVISDDQYPISKNLKLVIAGKKGWMYDSIFRKVKELKLEDRVVFTDFLPEEDKPALIKGAKVFVIPSFWEGFGLDAVSAMAVGVPVVASNIGSLPEVVGEAGILVDPEDTNSMALGIKKVLSMNKTEYNSIVKKGFLQAKKFSWEETARKTLEIIQNVHR